MKDPYRLVRRTHIYYAHERLTGKRISLETSQLEEARRLLAAKNQASVQPQLNTAMARVYLSATDPKLAQRTWQEAMDAFSTRGKPPARNAPDAPTRAVISGP